MSEKRFSVDNFSIKDNNKKGRLYQLTEQGGVNALCSLINGLNEKCERLVKENNRLREEKEKLDLLIINDFFDKYQIAFEEVKRGTDILSDLCPTCIHCLGYESEVSSSEGYVRTTKCIKRGTVKGVLSECNDYSK